MLDSSASGSFFTDGFVLAVPFVFFLEDVFRFKLNDERAAYEKILSHKVCDAKQCSSNEQHQNCLTRQQAAPSQTISGLQLRLSPS
jgi:hypothetical protein